MKKILLFCLIFATLSAFAQVVEDFSDGDFSEDPTWTGNTENFWVNENKQLQSNVETTATSYLSTPSAAIENAIWEFFCRITYNPSSSNYAAFYLVANQPDVTQCNGYFVQVGGTNDNVTLYVQEGTSKKKLIENTDRKKILDASDNSIYVRITRDTAGLWTLYSKHISGETPETEFVLEGEVTNTEIKASAYCGVLVRNSSTTGKAYYFDDIRITGETAVDRDAPTWLSAKITDSSHLRLTFSEAIDTETAVFHLTQGDDEIDLVQTVFSADDTEVTLTLEKEWEAGKIYTIILENITDLAGNALTGSTVKQIGLTEQPETVDLALNEIMFNPAADGQEYVEIANRTDKLLDVSGLTITTRKSDGTFNTGNIVPENAMLMPYSELAICADAASLTEFHRCPAAANVLSVKWSQALNNDGTMLYLLSPDKTIVFDSVNYSPKWHHALIKNEKGVALERIHPDLSSTDASSWHSASSEVNYGTPGYQNSQYRDIHAESEAEKYVWPEPEAFSPDGDGFEDVCFIRYAMPDNGFAANVRIFTPSGLLLAKIAENALLATEGFFTWDGTALTGKNANIGVYVLVFEAYNTNTGKTIKRKLPIVVSGR